MGIKEWVAGCLRNGAECLAPSEADTSFVPDGRHGNRGPNALFMYVRRDRYEPMTNGNREEKMGEKVKPENIMAFTDSTMQELARLAAMENLSVQDLIVKAIKTETFMVSQKNAGNTLLVADKNKKPFAVIDF
ncbi:MAG: hypothetical protein ACYC2R_03395 [Burkholderiales bacterium]